MVVLLTSACAVKGPKQPPFSPQEALKTFRIDPRFKVELYAAEPLLDGPAAMAFDGKGRAFVFELPAFPPKPADRGKVKLLEDADGDGRPDRFVLWPEEQSPQGLPADWMKSRDRAIDAGGNCYFTSPQSHISCKTPESELRNISDHGESAVIFPITENPVYPVLTDADRTTSTCGIACYSNAGIAGFDRALFTAEPVHNLVHCDLVTESAQGPVARRAERAAEFLASSDPWFRPVSFAVGPDAALYVVDYYAPVAGPTETLEVGIKPSDYWFRSSGKGRIYRIAPVPGSPSQPPLPVDGESESPRGPARGVQPLPLPGDPAGLEQIIGNPREMDSLQVSAIRALGELPGANPAAILLSKWRKLTALPRAEAVEAIFKEPARLNLLLTALEKEQIPLWTLDARHRVRLLAGGDRALAERMRRLLEAHDPGRNPTVKKYEAALGMQGNKDAGEQIYRRLCGRCHTLRGGSNYGPDLWSVSSRPPRQILIDILLPSNSIVQGRELFVLDLNGGGTEGVIGSQTETSLNILHDESRQETVFRKDIRRMLMSDFSAMPVDLASQISVRDMADLLRFLTSR